MDAREQQSSSTDIENLLIRARDLARHLEKEAGRSGAATVVKALCDEIERLQQPGAPVPGCDSGSPFAQSAPMVPTVEMLNAAREWSREKYGKPIGNDAATGCWQAMMGAAFSSTSLGTEPSAPAPESSR